MTLENELQELQRRIAIISVYKIFTSLKDLPLKKSYNIDEVVRKQVLEELVEFSKQRIQEIEANVDFVKSDEHIKNTDQLSHDEVNVLKVFVKKLMARDGINNFSSEIAAIPTPEDAVLPPALQAGSRAKIVAVANLDPIKYREHVCAYDDVVVLSITGETAKIKHLGLNELMTIPVDDLEM